MLLTSAVIPQHDRLDDLLRLLRDQALESRRISSRQRSYRLQALSILGLYDRSSDAPTDAGERVLALQEEAAWLAMLQCVRETEVFRAWVAWSEVSSTMEIDPDTARVFLQSCSSLAPSTAKRRSRTLHAWWRSAHADANFHGTQAVLPLSESPDITESIEPGTAGYAVACLTGQMEDDEALESLASSTDRLPQSQARMTPAAQVAELRDLLDLEAFLFVRLASDTEGAARWAAFVDDYNGNQLGDFDEDESPIGELGARLASMSVGTTMASQPRVGRRLRQMLEQVGVRRSVRSAFVVHATRQDVPEALAGQVQQFHAIRWHLLSHHLGMVGRVAQRYKLGLPYEHAFVVALGGGVDGVDRWEEGRGANLATVVSIWSRARLTRAVGRYRHGRHRSGHLGDARRVLHRARRDWVREARLSPTRQDMVEAWAPESGRGALDEIAPRIWWSDELDSPRRAGLSGLATLPAEDELDADTLAELARIDGVVRQALAERVDPRTRRILEERMGLHGEDRRTLSAVGRDLGLSRERVRQLERDGLERVTSYLSRPGMTTPTT